MTATPAISNCLMYDCISTILILFMVVANLQKGQGCYIHILKKISCSVPHCCISYIKDVNVSLCFSSFSTILSVFKICVY